jgi:sugar (pentulose or hexulose) kinase
MLARLGVSTDQIVACGGGTRSTLWLQILSDIAGMPISLPEVQDAVCLGTAMCAATGAGAYPNLRAAGAAMVRKGSTIEPNLSLRTVYEEGYQRYRDTYVALRPLFQRAASQ